MPRKSSNQQVESDGPSTADVSANEDVEMQDQDQDSKMSGFKKFGVSASRQPLPPRALRRRRDGGNEALREQTG